VLLVEILRKTTVMRVTGEKRIRRIKICHLIKMDAAEFLLILQTQKAVFADIGRDLQGLFWFIGGKLDGSERHDTIFDAAQGC